MASEAVVESGCTVNEAPAEENTGNPYTAFCPVPNCRVQIFGEEQHEVFQFLIDHMATQHSLRTSP